MRDRRFGAPAPARVWNHSWSALAVLGCALLHGTAGAQAPQQTTAATPPPIEHFTRWDEFGDIKISPDGEYVAISTGKNGRETIAFIDLKGKQAPNGVRAPEPLEVYDFEWVSPTRIIYRIAERYTGRATPVWTGEIYAINRDGSGHRQIYGYRLAGQKLGSRLKKPEPNMAQAEIVSLLRDDDDHILIVEQPWKQVGFYWRTNPDAYPRISRLNVHSGDKHELGIAPLRLASILVDNTDQVRFATGLNEQFKPAVSWKPTPDAAWTEFEFPGFRESTLDPHRFTPDGRAVLFSAVRERESLPALYRLDLQTRAVEKVHEFEGAEVTGVVADLTGREIVGVRGYGERALYHWLAPDDAAAKMHTALQRAFPGQRVSIHSASRDGGSAIVFVRSDVNPGEYYLFDTKTMRADFLRATRAWIDPRQMRPKQPIKLAARDGLQLHGYLTQPASAGPHPLVVLPHGGPHGIRDYADFDEEVQLLASRGYAVLQINFRGSGGYGVDFEEAGFKQWGAQMQDDLTDATRWAIEQKITQPDRICIYGASYGGFAALMGAAREPDMYRCAIGWAGVYDLELMYSSGDIPGSRVGQAYLAMALGDDVADLRSRSPVTHVERIKAPVLLIHGARDQRVDYDQATRMKEALEKHGKTFEWLGLAEEGHGAYNEQTRRQVYERILAFLDKHLMRGSGGE